jgi:RecA-family ATPase
VEADAPPEPPLLIKGILHQGLKAMVAGASKSMKSWLVLHISVCVAAGVPWLGQFPTTKARVFFLNLELPKWHFDRRLKFVTEALGVELEPGMFNAWSLRGVDLSDDKVWDAASERIARASQIALITIDPLYKLFNEQRAENETTGSAAIMRRFDVLAEETGAAPLCTHHFSKGSPVGKESIDRFSGSGVLIRDPDVYLSMTRHEQEDAFTIEPTLRCLPPQKPFVIRWNYPLFEIAPSLDAQDLKQSKPRGRKAKYSIDQMVRYLGNKNLRTNEYQKVMKDETGMSEASFHEWLEKAKAAGRIYQNVVDNTWEVIRQKGAQAA